MDYKITLITMAGTIIGIILGFILGRIENK